MRDILQQMLVTAANGEQIMFLDARYKAAKDGKREEYEAARLENLMKLGVTVRQEGPLEVTGVSVTRID